MDMKIVMRRLGMTDQIEQVLPITVVDLYFKDGTKCTVIPYEVKNIEGRTKNGQELRLVSIQVKEWYEDGEYPPAGKV